jgi:hypothetical protein
MNKYFIYVVVVFLLGCIYLFNTKNNNLQTLDEHEEVRNVQRSAQSPRGYELEIVSKIDTIQPHVPTTIRYRIKDDKGEVVKKFETIHEKIMHFIVVRKDLQYFQHLHPDFHTDAGEFSLSVTFADYGSYRLFADFAQAGMENDAHNQPPIGVPYKDIQVGNAQAYVPVDIVSDMKTSRTVGEYEINYSFPQKIQVGKEVKIILHLRHKGQPITTMEEYLGAQAHGILLKKDTLDFFHLHAMGSSMTHVMNGQIMTMETISKGPDVNFTYTFPTNGTYKLFTQFQHQGNIITTDYTIEVNYHSSTSPDVVVYQH